MNFTKNNLNEISDSYSSKKFEDGGAKKAYKRSSYKKGKIKIL